jgi:hypothetical protein
MTFDDALEEIRSFWGAEPLPFGRGDAAAVARLQREFGVPLPTELAEYVGRWAPAQRLSLDTVGNPIDLYSPSEIGFRAEGYNWNPFELLPSIPELLVLAAAQHHALSAFGPSCDAVLDDERGFNLNEAAAAWYFPFVRRVAPESADRRLYVFDNARE